MAFLKKNFPYILLNIFVSAATMLLVLWLWQKPAASPIILPTATQPASQPSDPTAQQSPAKPEMTADPETPSLSIDGVFGAGDPIIEYILIRNKNDQPVMLNGWKITSSTGKEYNLPSLTLNKNGAFRLYSKHGTNTVLELYWNSDQALWTSGSQINLINADGEQIDFWLVP